MPRHRGLNPRHRSHSPSARLGDRESAPHHLSVLVPVSRPPRCGSCAQVTRCLTLSNARACAPWDGGSGRCSYPLAKRFCTRRHTRVPCQLFAGLRFPSPCPISFPPSQLPVTVAEPCKNSHFHFSFHSVLCICYHGRVDCGTGPMPVASVSLLPSLCLHKSDWLNSYTTDEWSVIVKALSLLMIR